MSSEAREREEKMEEYRALARYQRNSNIAAFVGIYVVWVVMSYFIFVYGMVVYNLLGASAQNSFSATWGMSYLLDNISQWKDVATTAVQTVAVLYVYDALRIISDGRWFEAHLDTLSVQATLLSGARAGWWERTRTYIKFTARIGGGD